DSASPLLPLVQGLIGSDIAYIGFAQPLSVLAGADNWKPGIADAGWYFAIQERPGHTRFGLDATAPSAPATWSDLSWQDPKLAGLTYLDPRTQPALQASPHWGASAATMAVITERLAVRIAFHVRELMTP
ncbi:MAG TPA: hypothetical protein VLT45_10210, partial [Kofleriaceae bacterium]|nr:hypothetical protein [Kofleriaceae bacterium]